VFCGRNFCPLATLKRYASALAHVSETASRLKENSFRRFKYLRMLSALLHIYDGSTMGNIRNIWDQLLPRD
jgi:hypothetical protein